MPALPAEGSPPLLARSGQAPARALYKYFRFNPSRVVPVRPEGNSPNVEANFGDRQHQAERGSLPFRHRRHHHSPELTLEALATSGGFLRFGMGNVADDSWGGKLFLRFSYIHA